LARILWQRVTSPILGRWSLRCIHQLARTKGATPAPGKQWIERRT